MARKEKLKSLDKEEEEGEEEGREGWRKARKEGRRLCLWTPPTPHREGLKLNIQKSKIMASSPIISWQIDEETMETVTDFIWGRGLQNHCRW